MARTPLMDSLHRALRLARAAERPNAPPLDELLDMPTVSRRRFLQVAAASGLAAVLPSPVEARTSPRVAIIGAGLAGLSAAWRLHQAGLAAHVYEGSGRVGGRVMSVSGKVVEGLVSELGASFINSDDHALLALVREMGLELLDLHAHALATLPTTYCVRGVVYSEAQVVEALRPLVVRMQKDVQRLPDEIAYGTRGHAARLDWTSLAAYLDRLGVKGWLRDLLDTGYVAENGTELDGQSSLNMLTMVSERPRDAAVNDFSALVMDGPDERYMVRGGNQQIADRVARRLGARVHLEHRLERVRPRGHGWRLDFSGGAPVLADVVILCLPIATLRNVDLSEVEMPAAQRRAIQSMVMGQGAKVVVGFKGRPWQAAGRNGWVLRESPYQMGWDDSFAQGGENSTLSFFNGGLAGVGLGSGSVEVQAERLLQGLDAAFPGATAQANGRSARFHWPSYAFARGSYSCYGPGQWTTVRGLVGKPLGSLYFAGEYCSLEHQGYMNGAVQTGLEAAKSVLLRVGVKA